MNRSFQTAGRLAAIYGKTALLILAIIAGLLVPEAHWLVFLVPYLVAAMLFFSFLDLSIGPHSFGHGTWAVLAANIAIAFVGYFVLLPFSLDLALVAFFAGISPTAISAPAITSLLGGKVDFVVASVITTNLFMAALLPPVLPLVAGAEADVSTLEVAQVVLFIVIVPMALARIVDRLPFGPLARKGKPYTFYVLPPCIFLTTSRAMHFITREISVPLTTLAAVGAVSLTVCAVSFAMGAAIGGPARRREASQSLGQKNNSFTIWLALTFVNPLAALGPTFYVVYHNVYNSLQLYVMERRRRTTEVG